MRELAEMATSGATDLVIGQTTVVTVCLALMIWLGLLGRPSRASLLWTLAFMLALLGSYGSITAAAVGSDVLLHPVAIGLACGMPTVIWSGLRAMKGEPPYGWVGFVQSAASVTVLQLTTDEPIGQTVFRLVFLVAALGAALGALEVMRGPFRGSRFSIPLVVGSAALVLLSTIGVASSIAGTTTESSLLFTRGALMGTTIYLLCATVSLLFLANRRPGADDILEAMDAMAPLVLMRALVREKLLRARGRREQNWSFIDLRVDDAIDLREATGEVAFMEMVGHFEGAITRVFPADSDLCRVSPGHVLVFVSHSSSAARELVRTVLNETSAGHSDRRTSFGLTASAGLVAVDAATHTFDSLVAAAAAGVESAQLQGGDRWTRVDQRSASVPITE